MFLRYIVWAFFVLFSSHTCFAQCPPRQNIQEFLNSAEITQLENLASQLANCSDYQDTLGLVYHKIGIKKYYSDILNSIIAFQKAADLRNTPGDAHSITNLGKLYSRLGHYKIAINHFRKAIQVLQKEAKNETDSIKLVDNYIDAGIALGSIGDYELFSDYANYAIQLAQKIDVPHRKVLALTTSCNANRSRKAYEKSIEDGSKAIALIEQLPPNTFSNGNNAISYRTLGNVYYTTGEYEQALFYLKKSAKYAHDIPYILCETLNNIGLTHHRMNKEKQAIQVFQQILQKNLPCKDHAYNNLGDIYKAQKQYAKANEMYEKALLEFPEIQTINTSSIRDSIANISDKEGFIIYARSLAQGYIDICKNTGDTNFCEKAIELYSLLDYTIDFMRQQHYNLASKLFWRKEVHPIYEEAIAVCSYLNKTKKAFYFSEKTKGILLFDRVSENLMQNNLADSLSQQLNVLNRKIDYLQGKTSSNAETEASRTTLIEQKKALMQNIQSLYPEYFTLKYESLNVSLEDAQNILTDENTLMLEYFYGKDSIYTFYIDMEGVQSKTIALDTLLQRNLQQFVNYFTTIKGHNLLNKRAAYQILAHNLFHQLFDSEIVAKYSNIILIPDGYLSNIPFDALLTEAGNDQSYADIAYLGSSHNLSYGYSVPILSLQKSLKNRPKYKKVLAFFPEFPNEKRYLKYSKEEAQYIQDQAATKLFETKGASISNFMQHTPHYQIIHVGTHASAGDGKAILPSIEFYDKTLELSNFYDLKLYSDLLVLSACESGIGQYVAGEGVMSLARGFTHSGSNSLVSSLWQVNDRSTSLLMKNFYRHLANGMPKAQALHQAKKDYLADEDIASMHKTPFYWAGFVYVGNDTVVELAGRGGWWWRIFAGGVLIFGLGAWSYFRRGGRERS